MNAYTKVGLSLDTVLCVYALVENKGTLLSINLLSSLLGTRTHTFRKLQHLKTLACNTIMFQYISI